MIPAYSGDKRAYIRVLGLDYSKKFADLDDETARKDGFSDVAELRQALHAIYPDISEDTPVTIVHFELVGEGSP